MTWGKLRSGTTKETFFKVYQEVYKAIQQKQPSVGVLAPMVFNCSKSTTESPEQCVKFV